MEETVGVINPYALGEIIAGKSIKWGSVTDPQKMLSEILELKKEEIFDIKNPILSPHIQVDAKGKTKVLNAAEAKNRLESFLKKHPLRSQVQKLLEVQNVSAATDASLTKSSVASAVASVAAAVSSKVPWQPTDKEWVDKGDFFEDYAELDDPIQGALGNCYLIAALSSVAWARPHIIVNASRTVPNKLLGKAVPLHSIGFYKNGSGSAQPVQVTQLTPVAKDSHAWVYARSNDPTEIWPAVMEKAYAKWKTGNTTDFPNYSAIGNGGDPALACAELVRGVRTYKTHSSTSADDLWSFVRSHSLSCRTINPMTAWTYASEPSKKNYGSANVVANHAYSVLGWDFYNNEKYVVLRNPWGTHHATLDTRSGTWSAYQQPSWISTPLNSKGVFSMKVATFKQYFERTGVAV